VNIISAVMEVIKICTCRVQISTYKFVRMQMRVPLHTNLTSLNSVCDTQISEN